jgi:pimeloyl-ACP methyl ester carboxylesterase
VVTSRRLLLAVAIAWTSGVASAQTLPAGHLVELPGVKLFVRDTGGSGVPVILLHANTGTSASWAPQFAAFGQAGYRVIAFDRRGWGESIADPATGPQPGSVAGDLDALATDLHLPPFYIVGVAGGGFATLDYLGWHPERVRCAVIGASSGLLSEPAYQAFAKRIDVPALDSGPATDLELSASYRGSNPEGTARWVAIEAHAHQAGAPAQPLHMPNTEAKLDGIKTPVLVVAADADLLAPPAFMRMWAAHLAHHEWAVVDEAGHSIAWEKPDEFNALVLGYLARF